MNTSRIILIIINASLLVLGIIMLIFSRTYKLDIGTAEQATEIANMIYFCFCLFVILLGLVGTVGAVMEIDILVDIFALLVLIVVAVEIAIGVTIFIVRTQVDHYIEIGINSALEDYSKPNSPEVTRIMDELQQKFKCCGFCGPNDYMNHQYLKNDSVPDTCCKIMKTGCGFGMSDKNDTSIYLEGCGSIAIPKAKAFLLIFGIVVFVFASIKFVIVILARQAQKD